MKKVRSWSKPYLDGLIGRKKVDWSIFRYGTQIPKEFYDEFDAANGNKVLEPGETVQIELIIGGETYLASLSKIQRNDLILRFDPNKELKDLLIDTFKKTYDFIKKHREGHLESRVNITDEDAEYIDFYQTEKPFVYKVVLIPKSEQIHSFWWVNQGKTHNQEKEGEFLWAPQKSKRGFPVPHHVSLLRAKKGDLVFCYSEKELKSVGIVNKEVIESKKPSEIVSNEWQEDGYLLSIQYYDLTPSIRKEEIPIKWRKSESGPFDVNGDVKQGYFFELSDTFSNDLFKQFKDRFPKEVRYIMEKYENGDNTILIKDPSMQNNYTYRDLTNHIHSYITSKGFLYSQEEVTNLFLSLKSKPFVILSGISGTGKTKMVQWFAESIGANEDNGQFSLIPIRPDWNDGSDLLGYRDIKGDFKEGPLTKIIKRAADNPNKPYFVLLDEMNLARVEYYFSDILSVMESRKREGQHIVSSLLLTEEKADFELRLPNNLYIIGTVNMDETTHPFSKKVLDRANTIEFNQVELDNLKFLEETEDVEPLEVSNQQLETTFLNLKDIYITHREIIERATKELVAINKTLENAHAHVGYRVRDEICFYLAHNEMGDLFKFEEAFDYCVLQKILPRISGSDSRVESMLKELFTIFTTMAYQEDMVDLQNAKYPKSAKKVTEMLRRLQDDGFTSFWVS